MIILRIFNNKNSTYKYKKELQKEKFIFIKRPKYVFWEKEGLDIKEMEKLQEKYKKLGLRAKLINKEYARNSTYRNKFLKEYKTIKNRYLCTYCGNLFKEENITVDHIIPIDKAEKKKWYRFLLKVLKIENINDNKNLTTACKRCNSKKSNKGGLWILKGFILKGKIGWMTIYSIIGIALIYAIMIGVIKYVK